MDRAGRRVRSPRASSRGFRTLVVLVSLVALVDTALYAALAPLLPHYEHALGLSKAAVGGLVAAYPAGTLIGAVPGGVLAAKAGVRITVLSGLALMSVSIAVFGYAHTVGVLDGARFVQGVAGACTWAGGFAWLNASASPERRGSMLGTVFGAAVAGAMFGPLVGVAAVRFGTGPTFVAAAVLGSLLMTAGLLTRAAQPPSGAPVVGLVAALHDQRMSAGLGLTLLAGLAIGAFDVLVPLRLNRLGSSAVIIGAAFLGSAALQTLLAPLMGRYADRRGRLHVVRLALMYGLGVCLLAPFIVPDWALLSLVVVGAPAFGMLFVPALALIGDGADRRQLHHGLAFGLGNLSWALGQAISAASSGALAQVTVDAVPFLLVGGAMAGTLLLSQLRPAVERS